MHPRDGLQTWPGGGEEGASGRRQGRRLPETVEGAVKVPVAVNLLPMKLPLPEKLLPFQVALLTVVFTLKPPRLKRGEHKGTHKRGGGGWRIPRLNGERGSA